MKKLTLVGAALVFSHLLFAQTQIKTAGTTHNHEVARCSHDEKMLELQQNNPQAYSSINNGPVGPIEDKFRPKDGTEKTGTIYTIPVVFHILHNNGTENISDAQIQDQLNILNRDYRLLNSDANNVASAFQGMPSDVEIEFAFATKAPNGACFSGITRTVTTLTNNGASGQNQVNAVVSGNNVYQGVWPHNKYLNIYIAADIGGAAGYTYNPNTQALDATGMYYNGIFLLHDYCGSIGTSSDYTSRSLTHEVGHWLNLSHVWGANNNPGSAGCGGTDNVQDTPDTQGSNLACDPAVNSCSTDNAYWGFNQIDNVENYMDYSYCSKMFTAGQVTRMRAAIISSVGGRSNIWTTTNLNNVCAVPGASLCAMELTATDVALCIGDQTTFTMSAGGAPITSYSWTFTGGTPSSSTAASPTVTYNTAGTYQVSLTVVSGGNSYTKTKTAYISVAGGTLVSLPITEGFTAGTIPFTNWTLTNVGDPLTWTRNTSVGIAPTAGNSARLDNYSGANAGNDEMGLPNFNAASLSSLTMEFDVAYRPYNSTYYDGLQVLASGDCGATYTTVYDKSNLVLATVGTASTAGFVPTAAQWRHETIDLNSFVGSSRVILRIKAISGNGNYMYIDNLNISGVTSNTPPVAGFTPSVTSVCAGQTVTFTNTSTGSGNTYNWSFPGGTPSTSTATNPTVTYSTAGTYSVTLDATNGNGTNSNTQSNSITVNAIPSAPTISAGGVTTFCQGGSVTLNSTGGGSTTWSPSGAGASINATTSGTYTATVTTSGCQSTASNSIVVTVNPNPTVTFGSVSQLCVYDSPITLTQGSPAGGSYSGTGVSGNQFDPATAGAGNQVLTYSYTNGNGCSGSAQTTVVVSQCLGINEANEIILNIYPNPSEGKFSVVANDKLVATMIYDQAGKLVKQIKGDGTSEVAVDLTAFAGGVYTVKVITETSAKSVPVMLMK